MKQRFTGKYASGNRKAAMQLETEAAFIKSLPLATRKLIKARNAACAAFNQAVREGAERETVNALGAEYRQLCAAVAAATGRHPSPPQEPSP